jgi:hypothetical protein
LNDPSPTLFQTHIHIRCLCFRSDNATEPQAGLHGKPPSLTPIIASTFGRYVSTGGMSTPDERHGGTGTMVMTGDEYNASAKRFYAMFGFNDTGQGEWSHGQQIVSLGDEIGVERPGKDIDFVQFLAQRAVQPADVGCALPTWGAVLAQCNASSGACAHCGANNSLAITDTAGGRRLFVYSTQFMYHAGLAYCPASPGASKRP